MNRISDYLREGLAEANHKIGKLSAEKVEIEYRSTGFIPLSEICLDTVADDQPVWGVAMTLMSAPTLKLLTILDCDGVSQMCDAILGSTDSDSVLRLSVLQEFGNIVGTVIANRMASDMKQAVKTSPPETIRDLAGAIVNTVIADLGDVDDHLVLIDAGLLVNRQLIGCNIYLLYESAFHEHLNTYL